MLERHNGLDPDPDGAFTYYDQAQATIDDLQGQLETAQAERDEQGQLKARLNRDYNLLQNEHLKLHEKVKQEAAYTKQVEIERDALQQRVAQLAEKVAHYDRWLSGGVYYTNAEFEEQINDRVNMRNERAALKLYWRQRVAQLEALLDTHKTEYRAVLQSKAKEIDEIQADCVKLRDRVTQLEGELKRYAGCGHDHSTAWWQLRCEDTENDKVILQRHLQESAEQLGKLQANYDRVLGLVYGLQASARGCGVRDINRIRPILEIIEAIWIRNPDWRLMQLLGNLNGPIDPYYTEDDVLMERLKEYRKLMRQAEGEPRA